jgi:CDP-glucose 4,6-dehydratase
LLKDCKPEFIFHLAAQPLVRLAYEQPIETYSTNVMGTAHLLEAVRHNCGQGCVVVAVTTDKCYENKEWVHSYREEDPMGGYDPYSSSKGAAELVISAYRRSYFSSPDSLIKVASARAGNVIGGGDWASDRIVPDCVRALSQGRKIQVRNKRATRPWQHVLEPLSGYLWLAARLSTAHDSEKFSGSFNFGPSLLSNRTVAEVVEEILKIWPGCWEDRSDPSAPHEANLLNLATDKAHHVLQWSPVWSFEKTLKATVEWYRKEQARSRDIQKLTGSQIAEYTNDANHTGLPWAQNQPQN